MDPISKRSRVPTEESEDNAIDPNLLGLSREMWLKIFSYNTQNTLLSASVVCKSWYYLATDNHLWKRLALREPSQGTADMYSLFLSGMKLKELLAKPPTISELSLVEKPLNDYCAWLLNKTESWLIYRGRQEALSTFYSLDISGPMASDKGNSIAICSLDTKEVLHQINLCGVLEENVWLNLPPHSLHAKGAFFTDDRLIVIADYGVFRWELSNGSLEFKDSTRLPISVVIKSSSVHMLPDTVIFTGITFSKNIGYAFDLKTNKLHPIPEEYCGGRQFTTSCTSTLFLVHHEQDLRLNAFSLSYSENRDRLTFKKAWSAAVPSFTRLIIKKGIAFFCPKEGLHAALNLETGKKKSFPRVLNPGYEPNKVKLLPNTPIGDLALGFFGFFKEESYMHVFHLTAGKSFAVPLSSSEELLNASFKDNVLSLFSRNSCYSYDISIVNKNPSS